MYNENSIHAINHTSPLKYFEYIGADLKIISVDYLAHRELPGYDNLYYFDKDDSDAFIKQVLTANKDKIFNNYKKNIYSVDQRIKKLIKFFARLEGFEPPTP